MFEDYIVFDYEVSVRCPIGNNKAHPRYPGNFVVLTAYKTGSVSDAYAYHSVVRDKHHWEIIKSDMTNAPIIVGQNLPFDLQWLTRVCEESGGYLNLSDKTFWDIGIAEYVLSGQEHKFPSLDEMSIKYGLPLKDKRVADFWAAGENTEDIPHSLIVPYGCRDVCNTETIFLHQLTRAKKEGVLKLILVLNDAMLATTSMMWNGMKVNRERLTFFLTAYKSSVSLRESQFKLMTKRDTGIELSISSPKQLSYYLFGGEMKLLTQIPAGNYKTGAKAGQTKFKTVEEVKKFRGLFPDAPEKLGLGRTVHGYSMAEDTINKLEEHYTHTVIHNIKKYKEEEKQINTYFDKALLLSFPGDYIHHNINHTATTTGRLSSSEPNLQNITSGEDSDIKKCYISRWGDSGYLVELDFQQLEIAALAQLSKDTNLINDITNGVDIHSKLFQSVHKRPPTKEERRQFKRAVFALLYGAGTKKISKLTGMNARDATLFIDAWTTRYPDTMSYWNTVNKTVNYLRLPSEKRDAVTGKPLGITKYRQPTGRILTFVETIPEWRPTPGFSPNDIKNYPIQSFATGDIVPLFVGKLHRRMCEEKVRELLNGGCVLVNTVHDSVLLDCHKSILKDCVNVLKEEVNKLPSYIKQEFGIDMVVPLKTKITYGPNWNDQEEINETD